MHLLRVIQITNPESGGPIEALTRTSEFLIREGHTVEVVSLEAQSDVDRNRLPFPVTGLGRGLGKYGDNPRFTPWMMKNAKRFDAVIVHGLWSYSSLGAWRALKRLDVPYYVFPHGMMDSWFRDAYPVKHTKKQLYWWFGEGRVLRDARAVFFTSEEEMLRAQNVFRGFSYSERVVRYGTAGPLGNAESDRTTFFAEFPELIGIRFLLFLGRIHPKKGCDILIRAFAECAVNEDLHLVMAGPDQVGWTQELKRLASGLQIENRIHWTGMLKGQLKWGALRCADAIILPSHQENFGIVVAESMACSTPVLISNKVNIWREVDHARAGLVADDTLEGTRSLLRGFLALTATELSQMRSAAREEFLRSFEIGVVARDLMRQIGFTSGETASAEINTEDESTRFR